MTEMTRTHVRAMMSPQGLGYAAAVRVLHAQKARPDYFVYLEELRKQQLATRRKKAASDGEDGLDEPCTKSSTLFNSRMIVS